MAVRPRPPESAPGPATAAPPASRRWHRRSAVIWLCMCAAALLLSCSPSSPYHRAMHRFYHMDTQIDVTVVSAQGDSAVAAMWQSVEGFLADWDARYSDSGASSEIAVLNNRRAQAVRVERQLGDMIADALRYGDSTGGYFDITILPLKDLWGLGYDDRREVVPPADSIAATLSRVGYRAVRINATHDTVTFSNPRAVIDAGGFAKGYALIRVGELLRGMGLENYLVAAGDIVARGRKENGSSWTIGIQHPRRPASAENALMATVELDSGAIFTSGDYERRWQSNPLVHHIFSPYTGCSCTKNQSLTIWSMDPVQAKFLSTGLFCWPAESIMAYVAQRNLQTVIVDSSGTVTVSPGWRGRVKFRE